MNAFYVLKSLHITAVVVTASLFLLRGFWMLQGSRLLQHPFVRVAPHVNDTVLLLSALGTATLLGQFPFVNDWLTTKFLALIVYILLGHIALRRGSSLAIRSSAFVAALLTLGYIIAVAVCHDPLVCLGA